MRAIILGIGSDIGRELGMRLCRNGYYVTGYKHYEELRPEPWDLIVCCYGKLEPIGSFWDLDVDEWEYSFRANVFLPLRDIRELYPHRRPGASVCLFSGAGTNGPAPTYSAYCAAKVALVKMTELLDDESPDCKFFILGPGMVRTKIHEQIMRAGDRAANHQRVLDFLASPDSGTSHDDIYACLMACVAAPKAAVGGRNVCVHLDAWENISEVGGDKDFFKLRRRGDEALRRGR